MKDRRLTALRLLVLSLIAFMGLKHNSLRQLKGTPSLRQLKGTPNGGEGGSNSSNGRTASDCTLVADTNRRMSSSDSLGDIQEGRVVISGKELSYRYPGAFSATTSVSTKKVDFVVGVLSMTSRSGYLTRQMIRSTWAKDYKGRVFFVVAGDWSKIETEFEQHQDLIWVDMEEQWLYLTYKVQTFYHAVAHHFGLSYNYIFKTDDDSYVYLPAWEALLRKIKMWQTRRIHTELHYFGHCRDDSGVIRDPRNRYYVPKKVYYPDRYPRYALGDGYAVSKYMNTCMVDYMATIDYMPMEDVATGLLVRKCNSECINTPLYNKVQHHVKSKDEMLGAHMKYIPQVEEVEN